METANIHKHYFIIYTEKVYIIVLIMMILRAGWKNLFYTNPHSPTCPKTYLSFLVLRISSNIWDSGVYQTNPQINF